MFKKILIGLVAVLLVFLVVVAFQPSDFKIERSAVIAAPASAVFAQVNDFHKWAAWSPWDKVDPALKRTFEGPLSGKGSIYRWVGNSKVGEGSMTISESQPSKLIHIQLDFLKPMKGTNQTEFTFTPEGKKTRVTWSMTGQNKYASKVVCMFVDMEKMVGGNFEQGLAGIQSIVEVKSKKK